MKAKELALRFDYYAALDFGGEFAAAAAELHRLAALEQAEEPVPVGFVQALNEHNDEWVSKLPVGTALYTRQARKPMTDAQRRRVIDEAGFSTEGLTQDDFAQEIISGAERFPQIKE